MIGGIRRPSADAGARIVAAVSGLQPPSFIRGLAIAPVAATLGTAAPATDPHGAGPGMGGPERPTPDAARTKRRRTRTPRGSGPMPHFAGFPASVASLWSGHDTD